jgi:2-polyprenyl-6-methoxyphenol hydroxylase-like FAD-dependent oxidoreductase
MASLPLIRFLIVGAGAAGLMAARELARAGMRLASLAMASTSLAFKNVPKAGLAKRMVASSNGSSSFGAV